MAEKWFETWFDTSYYHLLYKNRDEKEARQLVDALLNFIKPPKSHQFLDVACGKGRHSIYLNSLGYSATGIDLSENCIDAARACSQGKVRFEVRDIRKPLDVGQFDIALNLFTSFGYFEDIESHVRSVKNIADALNPKGLFVIDYLNASYIKFHLIKEEVIEEEGKIFRINKTIDRNLIVKNISVEDGDQLLHFSEKVMAFSRDDLYEILDAAGLTPTHCFGDYELSPYASSLPRVIIIAQKNP
jgi:SAM-dependent methyltransferase